MCCTGHLHTVSTPSRFLVVHMLHTLYPSVSSSSDKSSISSAWVGPRLTALTHLSCILTKVRTSLVCYTPPPQTRSRRTCHVSPAIAASFTAFARMTLEEPWSSASFAPAALTILAKIMFTMSDGFGWSGCMREKSATVEPTNSQVQGRATILYIVELYGV